ncbi:hypothetical protein [Microbacterium allomyrinae]|uniref:Uncharacterized protein n=1 Tax=Microbacterium allomyrinae TaxID=2830666 RepID=A0A9X1S1X6_9MICO|nr:hypothetical protein [Microbacterium allomyrinae]MCC2030747.1 hypothetical protein [Microbacterium allomyrinae]
MPHDPLISALGAVIRIDVSALDAAGAAEVARVWADAAPSSSDGSIPVDVTVVAPAGVPIERLLSSLSKRVTLAAIEARRGEAWMLHAAGIADERGHVVVVIGPSGRGKTTAVRALAQRYGYVTDETIAIDGSGRVQPYRKPLSIIEGAVAVKSQRPPGELGLGALPAPQLRVAALVLLDRRPDGPDVPMLEECELGDVLGELVEQTSYLADLPNPLQTISALVAAVGGIRRVVYREADGLVDGFAPLFRDPGAMVRDVSEVGEPQRAGGERTSTRTATTGLYRGAYLDALVLDHPRRVALLQPDTDEGAILRVISGIGPALWSEATGRSDEELVSVVVRAHGEPAESDAASAVAAAIAELSAHGVVVRGQD